MTNNSTRIYLTLFENLVESMTRRSLDTLCGVLDYRVQARTHAPRRDFFFFFTSEHEVFTLENVRFPRKCFFFFLF